MTCSTETTMLLLSSKAKSYHKIKGYNIIIIIVVSAHGCLNITRDFAMINAIITLLVIEFTHALFLWTGTTPSSRKGGIWDKDGGGCAF